MATHFFFSLLLGLIGTPLSWAAPGDHVPLSYTEILFSSSSSQDALPRIANAIHNLKELIERLHPAEIENPEVFFYPDGPRGLPQFEIRGAVLIAHLPLHTFLKGDISVNAAECRSPWNSEGYQFDMSFSDSPDWIKESAAAVSGLICLRSDEAHSDAYRVSFDTVMIEGPNFSSITGKKLKGLLALQPERILQSIHEGFEKNGMGR